MWNGVDNSHFEVLLEELRFYYVKLSKYTQYVFNKVFVIIYQ